MLETAVTYKKTKRYADRNGSIRDMDLNLHIDKIDGTFKINVRLGNDINIRGNKKTVNELLTSVDLIQQTLIAIRDGEVAIPEQVDEVRAVQDGPEVAQRRQRTPIPVEFPADRPEVINEQINEMARNLAIGREERPVLIEEIRF